MLISSRNKGTVRTLPLLVLLGLYTIYTFGPLAWVFTMSLKNTFEIRQAPYSLPMHPRWEMYADVWF